MSDDIDCAAGCDARGRFSEGDNCAQAVIGALGDCPGVPALPSSYGAGFTTGIGGSGCVCGALAGGVALLGEYADTLGLEPAATRALAEEMSAELHARFTARFRSACCRVIKRGQAANSDEWLSDCAEITEAAAGMIAEIVSEHADAASRPKWLFRDKLSASRRGAMGVLAGGGVAVLAAAVVPAATAPLTFAVVTSALGLLAAAVEWRGVSARRFGRIVRTIGTVSAAVTGLLVLARPGAGVALMELLLSSPDPVLVAARVILVIAVLTVAGTSVFGLKRYR